MTVTAITPRSADPAAPLPLRLLARNLVPDLVLRFAIRRLLAERLRDERRTTEEAQQRHLMRFIAQLKASPIALDTRDAKEPRDELPCEFFEWVLGKHMKQSSCFFQPGVTSLDEAEAEMLALTCRRARIADGEEILELGCGWGSLTLWMAQRYPSARITAVTHSRAQKQFIDNRAGNRGLRNVQVIFCDINDLTLDGMRFDRVVSVEMFERMRNYEQLLARIASWMRPKATLFVHVFSHRDYAYPFDVRHENDWMARYFFSGCIMPSDHLLGYFQRDLRLLEHWRVDGMHYSRTSECWLANMDANRARIEPILAATYGSENLRRWWMHWRILLMTCAELWGYRGGREWLVSHYLFNK